MNVGTILAYSLASDIDQFMLKMEETGSYDAFMLAFKMLKFIELDRSSLYDKDFYLLDTECERQAAVCLDMLASFMRVPGPIDCRGQLLRIVHLLCAKLLLLFNGYGPVSDDHVKNVGLCFATRPELRGDLPLAEKYGVGKFYFICEPHQRKKVDLDKVEYAGLIPVCTLSPAKIGWKSYSIKHQMQEILKEIGGR